MSRFGDSHGLFAGRINQTTSPERTPSVAAKPVVTELAKSLGTQVGRHAQKRNS